MFHATFWESNYSSDRWVGAFKLYIVTLEIEKRWKWERNYLRLRACLVKEVKVDFQSYACLLYMNPDSFVVPLRHFGNKYFSELHITFIFKVNSILLFLISSQFTTKFETKFRFLRFHQQRNKRVDFFIKF